MQVTYFLNGPMFTLLFCCHFVLYWEKVISHEKLNHKSKLYGNFQRFNAIDGNIEFLKMVEYLKKSIKMKNCRTFYEAQTASRPSGNHSASPNQIKCYYVSGTRIFLQRCTEIYRYIEKYTAFKVLQECSSWASRNDTVQMFFWHQTEKCWPENLSSEKGLWLRCESILFSVSSELRFLRWVRFFERNCVVKRVIFLASFCWLWGFLLENQKNKKLW